MRFHIISLFPEAFESYMNASIIGRAIKDKKISVLFYNVRAFSKDKHRRADLKPYAGGPGMVMMVDPIIRAVEKAQKTIAQKTKKTKNAKTKIIITSPAGKEFTTVYAKSAVKKYTDIIIICGHYEGIDARVKKILKAEDVSIGNYVLTGGELPAMVMMDCMSRQVAGVLGKFESLEESRVSTSEVYTRPEVYIYKGKKYKVPPVLLSGNHAKIEEWKKLKNNRP